MAMRKNSNIYDTDMSSYQITRGRFDNPKVVDQLSKLMPESMVSRVVSARVDERMLFGINPYYLSLATGTGFTDGSNKEILPKMPPSSAIAALIAPRPEETLDLRGERDPSNQMRYSPDTMKGRILHKYDDIILAFVVSACSAHCRYCYRLDLFNKTKNEKGEKKEICSPEDITTYVRSYNNDITSRPDNHLDGSQPRGKILEVLLSGGDPMVLPNNVIFDYLAAVGEAGVDAVRIGTKELAFRPPRFDEQFFSMLALFHEMYPHVRIRFVLHFSHPDEFLVRNSSNRYVDDGGYPKWLPIVERAIKALDKLGFVTLENQTPIISGVNDNVSCLTLLHTELSRKGIRFKYTFQCRAIEGHKAFAVPVETAWRLHRDSQRLLPESARSRLVMSTEAGKIEILDVLEPDISSCLYPGHDAPEGTIEFRIFRSPAGASDLGGKILARRNPGAVWISDYEDRLLYDGRRPFPRSALG